MEHRIGRRKPALFEVQLSRNGNSLGHYMARDISMGGIGLRGTHSDLTVNTIVSVCIYPDLKSIDRHVELRAIVVHQTNGTIGLMWIDHEANIPVFREAMNNASTHDRRALAT